MPPKCLSGISTRFQALFQSVRQIAHVLLTRPPLTPKGPLDLHVLGTPPAFVLSQDQTLKSIPVAQASAFADRCRPNLFIRSHSVFSFQGTILACLAPNPSPLNLW